MITFSLRKLFIISYLTPINNWHSCIIIIHKRHETFSRKRATKKMPNKGKVKNKSQSFTPIESTQFIFSFYFLDVCCRTHFSTLVFPKVFFFLFLAGVRCFFLLLFSYIIYCVHFTMQSYYFLYDNNICTWLGFVKKFFYPKFGKEFCLMFSGYWFYGRGWNNTKTMIFLNSSAV